MTKWEGGVVLVAGRGEGTFGMQQLRVKFDLCVLQMYSVFLS